MSICGLHSATMVFLICLKVTESITPGYFCLAMKKGKKTSKMNNCVGKVCSYRVKSCSYVREKCVCVVYVCVLNLYT